MFLKFSSYISNSYSIVCREYHIYTEWSRRQPRPCSINMIFETNSCYTFFVPRSPLGEFFKFRHRYLDSLSVCLFKQLIITPAVSTYVRKRPFEELVTSLKFDSQKLHNGIVLLSTANHIATLGNKLRLERTEASFIALIVFEVCRWRENSFLPAWHAILVISHCKVEQSGRIVKMDPNDDLILSQIADNVESEYNQLTNNHENLDDFTLKSIPC